ncbi:hypothetical protein ACFWU5_01875 [Nocardia sp. NPDC058640]|uniref:hypothetical protein n=1 Tax=Nocardia sp. NPDC058640 TaxID=3346571 RepID=UPI00365936B1
MRDVTRAAGLKDEWDRIVVVFPGTEAAELNSSSGIADVCWKNLPPTYRDDTPHAAYYLFVQQQMPIQAVRWSFPFDREFDFINPRVTVVHPDTILTPIHVPGVDPYLRPARSF